jgi:hypothetical protein
MFDGHSLLSGLTTAIAVLGLFIVLEKRVIAAIRFGKTVMAEVGFLKSLDFHITKGVIRSHPAPAVLARPGCHPDPIDPHASIGRLLEAPNEVFDLKARAPDAA